MTDLAESLLFVIKRESDAGKNLDTAAAIARYGIAAPVQDAIAWHVHNGFVTTGDWGWQLTAAGLEEVRNRK